MWFVFFAFTVLNSDLCALSAVEERDVRIKGISEVISTIALVEICGIGRIITLTSQIRRSFKEQYRLQYNTGYKRILISSPQILIERNINTIQ